MKRASNIQINESNESSPKIIQENLEPSETDRNNLDEINAVPQEQSSSLNETNSEDSQNQTTTSKELDRIKKTSLVPIKRRSIRFLQSKRMRIYQENSDDSDSGSKKVTKKARKFIVSRSKFAEKVCLISTNYMFQSALKLI